MGGRPLFALNLVAWPRDELPLDMLAEVLAGGAEIGGGERLRGGRRAQRRRPGAQVRPGRGRRGGARTAILTNTGLRDGDALVLTKALGIGVATTAIKRGEAPDGPVGRGGGVDDGEQRARRPRGARGRGHGRHRRHRVRAARAPGARWRRPRAWTPRSTSRRCRSRRVSARWPRRGSCRAARGATSTGSRPCSTTAATARSTALLLADAQTSGGLLFGAAPDRAAAAVAELGPPAAVIGRVRAGSGRIRCADGGSGGGRESNPPGRAARPRRF